MVVCKMVATKLIKHEIDMSAFGISNHRLYDCNYHFKSVKNVVRTNVYG